MTTHYPTLNFDLGEDIDRNLVCVTSNKVSGVKFSVLFPSTTIGMGRLITTLINTAYAEFGPEEWTRLLSQVE